MIRTDVQVMEIGDVPVTELAKRYGTPMYVYDGEVVEQQVRMIQKQMHPRVQLFYSLKSNPNPTLVRWIYDLGGNLEICSRKELAVVKQIGASPERVLYLGPGKTVHELEELIDFGVRYLVVESLQEMETVNRLAAERNKVIPVGIRFNPNTSAKGSKLTMGGQPRQFGIDEDQLPDVLVLAEQLPHLQIVGVHVYNGTRILSADVLIENTQHVLQLALRVHREYQVHLEFVDIGGGMGIPYFEKEETLDFASAAVGINKLIEQFHAEYGQEIPIFLESGRFVSGECGVYVSEVQYTKNSKDVHFATLDGGTNHHMAAGGMGNALRKNFPIKVLNRLKSQATILYHITGPLCTPNDLIAKGLLLPEMGPGDLVGILNAGAYGLTASPVLFLSHDLPVEVFVYKGNSFEIRNREEYGVPALRTEVQDLLQEVVR